MYLPFSYSLLASHKRQNGRIDLADQGYKFARITPPPWSGLGGDF